MFASKNDVKRLSFIGQAIIQQIRPQTIIAPLQIAVAVQMHHSFSLRFLNEELYAMGFASSYSEVSRFERNAAVSKGIDIEGIGDGYFLQVCVV